MYEAYYGLREKPFAVPPDPAALYLSPQHRSALAILEYGLINRAIFTLLTGEVGSGKTILTREIVLRLRVTHRFGLITNTSRHLGSLVSRVCAAFGLETRSPDNDDRERALVAYLQQERAGRSRTVLIVDEAQNLPHEMLEELRMLSNVNDSEPLLQTLLIGQPELRETLRRADMRAFAQRIGADFHLKGLDISETGRYVQHRLLTFGGDGGLFTADAVEVVHRHSGGIPRLINQLCDTALVYGFAAQRRPIDRTLMDHVIADRYAGGIFPGGLDGTQSKVSGELPAASIVPAPQQQAIPAAMPALAPLLAAVPPIESASTEAVGSAASWNEPLLPDSGSRRFGRLFLWSAMLVLVLVAVFALTAKAATAAASPHALGPQDVAVVINTADPLSVEIGDYYRARRHIPSANVVRVRMVPGRTTLTAVEFAQVRADVDAQAARDIQAFVLTWLTPYRVDCMSITTAFAAGYDPAFCASYCAPTRLNAYFDSDSARPYADLHLRPTMSLAAVNFERARELIDRGVAADGTCPRGTAYLVRSGDGSRGVRDASYADVELIAGRRLRVQLVTSIGLHGRKDVMFYFIGSPAVPSLTSNEFLPGAAADHLTSFGGDLLGTGQMTSLRWLEAGATASYGTVAEPCNFTSKFPSIAILLKHYLAGETLLEAYWKSVAMPGQGIFIGEPLARPFGPGRSTLE